MLNHIRKILKFNLTKISMTILSIISQTISANNYQSMSKNPLIQSYETSNFAKRDHQRRHMGLVKLKKFIPKTFVHRLELDNPLMIQEPQWCITSSKRGRKAVLDLFDMVEQIHIQTLKIRRKDAYKIVKIMPNIIFPQLQNLYLDDNLLTTVQPLSQIIFPKLLCLSLCSNPITNISTLRRLNIPNLQKLYTQHNKINQLQSLAEIHTKKLSKLLIHNYAYFKGSQISLEDLGWVLKIQSTQIISLSLRKSACIKDPKIDKLIRNKFTQLQYLY